MDDNNTSGGQCFYRDKCTNLDDAYNNFLKIEAECLCKKGSFAKMVMML